MNYSGMTGTTHSPIIKDWVFEFDREVSISEAVTVVEQLAEIIKKARRRMRFMTKCRVEGRIHDSDYFVENALISIHDPTIAELVEGREDLVRIKTRCNQYFLSRSEWQQGEDIAKTGIVIPIKIDGSQALKYRLKK